MNTWVAEAVGKMHVHRISQSDLAARLGIRRDYLNKILNGKLSPKGCGEKIMAAINEMAAERKGA